MPCPNLPPELWLHILEDLDAHFLWTTVRNVSHLLRGCVDAVFRLRHLRNTVVNLHYFRVGEVDVHKYERVAIPMVFDRLSEDGSRAFFQQRAFLEPQPPIRSLSTQYPTSTLMASPHACMEAWLPFIERHHNELGKSPPAVHGNVHTSNPDAIPAWEVPSRTSEMERRHGDMELYNEIDWYLFVSAGYASIGHGNRPPYSIRFADATSYAAVQDTELEGLCIDCERHEISFDWIPTLSRFFQYPGMVWRPDSGVQVAGEQIAMVYWLLKYPNRLRLQYLFFPLFLQHGCPTLSLSATHYDSVRRRRFREWYSRNDLRFYSGQDLSHKYRELPTSFITWDMLCVLLSLQPDHLTEEAPTAEEQRKAISVKEEREAVIASMVARQQQEQLEEQQMREREGREKWKKKLKKKWRKWSRQYKYIF